MSNTISFSNISSHFYIFLISPTLWICSRSSLTPSPHWHPFSVLRRLMISSGSHILSDLGNRFGNLSRRGGSLLSSSGDHQGVARRALREWFRNQSMQSFFIFLQYSQKKKMSWRSSERHKKTSVKVGKLSSFSMRSTGGANLSKMSSFLGWKSELLLLSELRLRILALPWSMPFFLAVEPISSSL